MAGIEPRFPLGRVLITPNALNTLDTNDVQLTLHRHQSGDWGEVCLEDRAENEFSLTRGLRLLSVYRSEGTKFWIITEADRSATTVLLPEDY